MTSILTNTGAMTALQTLRSINSNLAQTQNEISTGKVISSAKDNSAVWAISKVMESDVAGFKAIRSSLSLGESSVAVARNASESITDLLTDIKGKIVAAQEENVDRAKIQTDIGQLRDQITSIVNAAQFNGLNLVKGTNEVNILSSLDRAADGTVSSSNIRVVRQDLTADTGTYAANTNLAANITAANTSVDSAGNQVDIALVYNADTTYTVTFGGVELSVDGADAAITNDTEVAQAFAAQINALGFKGISASNTAGTLEIINTQAFKDLVVVGDATGTGTAGAGGTAAMRSEAVALSVSAAVNEGDGYQIAVGGQNYRYIAGPGESMEDVARGLKTAIDSGNATGVTAQVNRDATTGQWSVLVDYDGTGTGATITLTASGSDGGEASGGLFGLDNLDVRTDSGAASALGNIETMIQNAIDASASFGSAQSRIETQSEFISKLTDSLTAGIGTMVDADLEAASARLQALQVQQQLGIQSLSIANQAPQTILALFR